MKNEIYADFGGPYPPNDKPRRNRGFGRLIKDVAGIVKTLRNPDAAIERYLERRFLSNPNQGFSPEELRTHIMRMAQSSSAENAK